MRYNDRGDSFATLLSEVGHENQVHLSQGGSFALQSKTTDDDARLFRGRENLWEEKIILKFIGEHFKSVIPTNLMFVIFLKTVDSYIYVFLLKLSFLFTCTCNAVR